MFFDSVYNIAGFSWASSDSVSNHIIGVATACYDDDDVGGTSILKRNKGNSRQW